MGKKSKNSQSNLTFEQLVAHYMSESLRYWEQKYLQDRLTSPSLQERLLNMKHKIAQSEPGSIIIVSASDLEILLHAETSVNRTSVFTRIKNRVMRLLKRSGPDGTEKCQQEKPPVNGPRPSKQNGSTT